MTQEPDSLVYLPSPINDWLRRNTTLAYMLLVAVGILGAWLVGMFDAIFETDSTAQEVTLLDLLLSLFGLMIFCAAGVGLIVLIIRERKPMTNEEGIRWDRVRAKGKWSYIRNSSLRASPGIVLAISILALIKYSQGRLKENLMIYGAVTVIGVGCIIYAALNSWVLQESEYRTLNSKRQNDESSGRSSD